MDLVRPKSISLSIMEYGDSTNIKEAKNPA
jgi:hypothetical protein